jgi:hypothetical protein
VINAVEIASGAMIHIRSFIKIDSEVLSAGTDILLKIVLSLKQNGNFVPQMLPFRKCAFLLPSLSDGQTSICLKLIHNGTSHKNILISRS